MLTNVPACLRSNRLNDTAGWQCPSAIDALPARRIQIARFPIDIPRQRRLLRAQAAVGRLP